MDENYENIGNFILFYKNFDKIFSVFFTARELILLKKALINKKNYYYFSNHLVK